MHEWCNKTSICVKLEVTRTLVKLNQNDIAKAEFERLSSKPEKEGVFLYMYGKGGSFPVHNRKKRKISCI